MQHSLTFVADHYFGMHKGLQNYFLVEGLACTREGLRVGLDLSLNGGHGYHVRNRKNFVNRSYVLVNALLIKGWIDKATAVLVLDTVNKMFACFKEAGL